MTTAPASRRIEAYPGELNQVWTNLIDNALDAMNGAGTLRLTTRAEEDDIVVEVGDTGPGMPPQVAARAFDAFYTTKDAGKGTGLGLDIARRTVVERHGGTHHHRLPAGEHGAAGPPPRPAARAPAANGQLTRSRSKPRACPGERFASRTPSARTCHRGLSPQSRPRRNPGQAESQPILQRA